MIGPLRRLRRTRKGVFHVKWPIPKHFENSLRGVAYAIAHMFAWIDLDLSITKPDPHCRHHPDGQPCRGHIVACHWPKPMRRDGFRDPLGLIDPDTPIWDLTLDEALRLVARFGFRIRLLSDLLNACGGWIGALLEPKGDERFEQDWTWQQIRADVRAAGTHAEVYALPENSGALPFARQVGGFKAWEIKR